MTRTNIHRSRVEYQRRIEEIEKLVFRAGEGAGLDRSNMVRTKDPGCSLGVISDDSYVGKVVIRYLFGHPEKLLGNVEIEVSAYANNDNVPTNLPSLYEHKAIVKGSFPHDTLSHFWILGAIKQAVYALRRMCTPQNFERLERERENRLLEIERFRE